MPYFLDSNVLIGYYFSPIDTWGYEATKVFEDPEKNFTSSTVCSECFGIDNGGKCQTIKQSIVREFRRSIAQIIRDPSPDNLLSIAKGWKILPILKDIISDPALCRGDLQKIIRTAMNEYDRRCEERLKIIRNPAHLTIHRRTEGYQGIWHALNPILDDLDDVEIILDAHDLAGTVLPIFMYTGDFHNIYLHRGKILELTEISEIRFLGDVK